MIVSVGRDGSIRVWNWRKDLFGFELSYVMELNTPIRSMTRVGDILMFGDSTGYVHLVDVAERRVVARHKLHSGGVIHMCGRARMVFSGGGDLLLKKNIIEL